MQQHQRDDLIQRLEQALANVKVLSRNSETWLDDQRFEFVVEQMEYALNELQLGSWTSTTRMIMPVDRVEPSHPVVSW